MSKERNSLTQEDKSGIILNDDEARWLSNLRDEAQEIHHGEIDVTFKVHDDALKHGEITAIRRRI